MSMPDLQLRTVWLVCTNLVICLEKIAMAGNIRLYLEYMEFMPCLG